MGALSRWTRWLTRGARWALTVLAVAALVLEAISYFAVDIDFGTHAYWVDPAGRVVVHLPLEWAENEYSQDEAFPIDTDSLFGIVKYWLPTRLRAEWRPSGFYARRGFDAGWWGYWLDPLDTHTDGEYSETGARPFPITLLVYAAAIPSMLMWVPWRRLAWRRRGCRGCGYSLEGLPQEGGSVRCPECGTIVPMRAPARRTPAMLEE